MVLVQAMEDVAMEKWPLTAFQLHMVCRLMLWLGHTKTYNSFATLLGRACCVGLAMKALRLGGAPWTSPPATSNIADPARSCCLAWGW